jgi:hypothetical protein
MTERLRPSTLGEILDRTANIYRSRFLLFLGIAFLPASVILACAAVAILFFIWVGTHGDTAGPTVVGLASVVFLIVGVVLLLPACIAALGLGAGALNHAASAAIQDQPITIRGAYAQAWKRGWRYIGLLCLEGLILIIAPGIVWSLMIGAFAMAQIFIGRASAQPGPAMGAILLLFLIAIGLYAVWMLLMLCLSFSACVVEDLGAATAVKRSIALSKGTRGRLLVLYILGTVLRWGISFVLMIPLMLIVILVPGLDTPQHAQSIGSALVVVIYGGSFLVRALTKPIYTIAQMLFYYDQRIRKEGFDIEWLMHQAGMLQPPAAAAASAPLASPVAAIHTQPDAPLPADPPASSAAGTPHAPGPRDSALPGNESPPPPQLVHAEAIPPAPLPSVPGGPA